MARDKNAITYRRGDSYPKTVTITNVLGPVDLTGCTAVLTVASVENPDDETTQLFQVEGVLPDDPTTGALSFTPSVSDNSQVGEWYYDIQLTTAQGHIRTPVKSTYTITQDISK